MNMILFLTRGNVSFVVSLAMLISAVFAVRYWTGNGIEYTWTLCYNFTTFFSTCPTYVSAFFTHIHVKFFALAGALITDVCAKFRSFLAKITVS